MTGTTEPNLVDADIDTLAALAEQALSEGRELEVVNSIRDGAVRFESALWGQWTALLQRSLDRHEDALECFANASRLAPTDARIAQGRAHTAMEAGIPAVELYEEAQRLNPQNGPVIIGLTAARAAAGDGERAASDLRAILERMPMWLNGHVQLGQLLATLGKPEEATLSVERALERQPRAQALWETLLNIQLRRGAYSTLEPILAKAREAGAQSPEFAIYDAIHQAEFDPRPFPPALFEAAPAEIDSALDLWRVRHLLRLGMADSAIPIIDRGLQGPQSAELWAYAATAWRLLGDERSQWLEGDPAIVRVTDLKDSMGDLDRLARLLRKLHSMRGEYLDQSVRGGTQTDGPLLSRIEPEIRQLRAAIVEAIEEYRSALPPLDERHPLLRHRRDRLIRFAGSWSVRLRSGGRHSNHVHPQGWISSALYISLPQLTDDDAADAGWFTLGTPDEQLRLDLPPWRKIEPKVAQLVLFPSWMWHGTIPFHEGERLTVAFDVAPPR